jgi:hypothetical protein
MWSIKEADSTAEAVRGVVRSDYDHVFHKPPRTVKGEGRRYSTYGLIRALPRALGPQRGVLEVIFVPYCKIEYG